MSIEYRAMIIVGLPCEDIDNQDLLDDGVDQYDDLAGFVYMKADGYRELNIDDAEIARLKRDFFEVTGQEAKVFLNLWSF